jgi:phosphatidylglycerol:prolipoprotein diacylglycerol transferase
MGQDPEMAFTLAFWLVVPGIVGARAFYVIQKWPDDYWPVYDAQGFGALLGAVVNVAEGGLVVYGGLIGSVLGLLLFVRKYRLPLLAVCDLVAPSMMLGLALGRIGCLLNGCCFGSTCHHTWAVTFPPDSPPYEAQVVRGEMFGFRISGDRRAEPVVLGVEAGSPAARGGLAPGDRLARVGPYDVYSTGDAHGALSAVFYKRQPFTIETAAGATIAIPTPPAHRYEHSLEVHPTQIYSTINALLLCLLLLAYDPFRRRDGELFALFLSVYPVTRYLLEEIRTDETSFMGTGLSISQNVSLGLLVAAAALWYTILRRPPGKAFS